MKLIRLKEVMSISGLGRSSIYKFMAEGHFPQSISLGERAVAWEHSEIEEWIINKIEQRDIVGSDKKSTGKIAEITEADVITFIKKRFSGEGISRAITWLMQIIK
jgi:prophage regulatory protein